MPSVFISYSATDKAIARRISEGLEKSGISVWLDQEQILAGDNIRDRISEGLRSVDYLIVLLSESSNQSEWVRHEIGVAYERFQIDAPVSIIPVRIDSSPLSSEFQGIRHIDMSYGVSSDAMFKLTSRILDSTPPSVEVSSVVDVDDLATDLAAGRELPRGVGFYLTTGLTVLSIIATLFVAWPTFQTAFFHVPIVYFDVREDRLSLPDGSDESLALKILNEAGISPAALRVRVINRGQAAAESVKVGISTPGRFLFLKTDPKIGSKSVLVHVTTPEPFTIGDSEAALALEGLVPDSMVTVNLGFGPPKSATVVNVVSGGLLASRVEDIEAVPPWTLWNAARLPLSVLFGGLVLSILLGSMVNALKNPRLRMQLIRYLTAAISSSFLR